jgi:ABC-type branched-subunit amino acid transport system substrate-binding protein
MKSSHVPRWIRRGAIVAIMALIAGACSSKPAVSTPGVTATTIMIGSHQPLTGPAAPGYSEISAASNAYFKYVNDAGGVNGRKINYLYKDDGYNPTQTTSVVRQLVLQDKVFAIFDGLGTPTHLAVVDYLNSNNIPDVFVASGCNCWDNPSKYPQTFGWQTDYTIEGKILGKYVNDTYGSDKVGYFYQNDEFGQDGVKGVDQQVAAANVVSRQTYQPTNVNVAPQIAALQRSGAKVVVLYTIPAFTALALLTAASLHYSPTWVVSSVGSDPVTLTGLLKTFSKGAAGPALLNGMVTDGYLPPITDASNPWVQLFQKVHDRYIPTLPMDGNVEYGMAVAYDFVQALKAAGKDLTRAGLVAAIEGGKVTGGPGIVPYGYSSSSHLGFLGVQIAINQGGKLVPTGSVYQSTNDGPITVSSYKAATPPANGIP